MNRFDDINRFERHLTRNGTVVIKFFLNVSKGEQKRRLLERLDEPGKQWKFSAGDLHERSHWKEYQSRVPIDVARDEHRMGAVVRDSGRSQVHRSRRRRLDIDEPDSRARARVPDAVPRRQAAARERAPPAARSLMSARRARSARKSGADAAISAGVLRAVERPVGAVKGSRRRVVLA